MIYGYNKVTGKEISCDRKKSTGSHNCGVFGTYGTGKTVYLKREIAHILNESNDRVFIIDIDCEYNGFAALCSDFMVKVSDESDIVIPCDKQLTIFSFTAMSPKKLLSCYKACLESVWEHIRKHQNCYSWVYLEVIEVLFRSNGGAALLADIAKETRTHNCSLTFTSAAFEEIYQSNSGKMLLENTDFVVHFTQLQRSRKFIQPCYRIDDTLLHFLTDQSVGTGLIKTCDSKAYEPFSCYEGQLMPMADKIVVRIHDGYGTYFCGFSKDDSQILLSRAKENAVVYNENEDLVVEDMVKVIRLTNGDLQCFAQKFEAAPDFADEE